MSTITLPPAGSATYRTLNRIAMDAGNASMRRAGRKAWSEGDFAAAQAYFEQLVGLHALPGEALEDTHCRLQDLARGTWHEGTGPDAGM